MSNVKSSASLPYKLRPVPISLTRPAPAGSGQRSRLFEAHVDYLVANLDLNALGHPCVNYRDGVYWVFDGQHRIEALKRSGFGDSDIDCHVYEGLDDAQMAAMFLRVNTGKAVDVFSKFMNGCSAGFKPENDVRRMIEAQHLRVSKERQDNSVGCVSACLKVYHTHGEVILGKALRVIRDAYDGAAKSFDGNVIQALALVFGRYDSRAVEKKMVEAIAPIKQGVVGIAQSAERLRLRVGNQKVICIAATLVDIYNKNERSTASRLPSWWQE